MPAHPSNVPGDFYVENECCLLCGVPSHYAPGLFADDNTGCWVARQPATPTEHAQMMTVLENQDLGCIKYRGKDPHIIEVVRRSQT
jgi:hypothetical protein